MNKLYRLYEFFFDRWEITIKEQGVEIWHKINIRTGYNIPESNYPKNYVTYKYKHKFCNKEKLVKEYLD